MRVVLDTNVIISGLLFPGGPPDRIVRAVLAGGLANATSPDLLAELQKVLKKKFSLPENRLAGMMMLLSDASEIVYPLERIEVIRADPPDNRVLECAVTSRADAIVTGDTKHLLKMKSYRGIPILSPVDFIRKTGLV